MYDQDPKQPSASVNQGEHDMNKKEGRSLTMIIGLAAIGILSFLFAKFIFTLVPAIIASFFKPIWSGDVSQILLEGFFKIVLLLGYIYAVSLTPLMKRVFQYHGAEHKVINTYESGEMLTVENVKQHSRLHLSLRLKFYPFYGDHQYCSLFLCPNESLWLRLLYRVLLIPVDLGVAYEVLRLTNKVRDIPFLRWLGYPGLWLQLLTTKDPDSDQIEVAIRAFEKMRTRESTLEEAKRVTNVL
ncbi:DUF1385 domain-containing protein [Terrilactibacillus sp. S3-3]|nr:DUF1385 domain-containing protein [Terrilactibacillus sp. S3-3]